MNPVHVAYTTDSIAAYFPDGSSVDDAVAALESGGASPEDYGSLPIVWDGTSWWALPGYNRVLYAAREDWEFCPNGIASFTFKRLRCKVS